MRKTVGAPLRGRPVIGEMQRRGGHGVTPRQHPVIGQRPVIAAALSRLLALFFLVLLFSPHITAQTVGSHSSRTREALSPESLELIQRAITVVCTERDRDPLGSIPIDDMQGRPSIPLHTPEAVAGARRAQRLLPIARNLTIRSLRELVTEYNFHRTPGFDTRIRRAIARLQAVRSVKPDMESRDNASVFLRRPHTITFGTIFLTGLPSDEGMISVLSHELMHIADGNSDSLKGLFDAVGNRASRLTGLQIHDQRAEELTCDLVGVMAARAFVSNTPDYQPLPRRLARSVAHNCVTDDEDDEDHLSPRSTIRALLALRPILVRELVYGEDETVRPRTLRRR